MTRGRWGVGALGALNLVGASLYLRLAAPRWRIAAEAERGIHVTTAEPFLWVLGALPVLLIFAAVDLRWAIALVARRGTPQSGRVLACVVLLWVAAVAVDFSRH